MGALNLPLNRTVLDGGNVLTQEDSGQTLVRCSFNTRMICFKPHFLVLPAGGNNNSCLQRTRQMICAYSNSHHQPTWISLLVYRWRYSGSERWSHLLEVILIRARAGSSTRICLASTACSFCSWGCPLLCSIVNGDQASELASKARAGYPKSCRLFCS